MLSTETCIRWCITVWKQAPTLNTHSKILNGVNQANAHTARTSWC